jgi:hypothetical protein
MKNLVMISNKLDIMNFILFFFLVSIYVLIYLLLFIWNVI